jgi:hypothetical protein
MFLRYEDFATKPREAVARVLAFLGEDGVLPFVEEDTVVLGVNHTVAGNPNRFRVGTVRISLDRDWSLRMPRHRQLLVLALTWPLLVRYRLQRLSRAARSRPRSPGHAPGRRPFRTRFIRWVWRATGRDVRSRR